MDLRTVLFSLACAAGIHTSAHAYFGAPGTQVPVKKSSAVGSPYGYYEYLPPGYSDSGSKKYPVILFLHGIGEKGNGESELGKVVAHGPSKLIRNGRHFEAIVVSAQSPGWWQPTTINTFVNYLFATYKSADPERLYVTGLSMGGAGVWNYITAYPNRVAAAIPICGAVGGNTSRAKLYGMPIWAFHAFNDTKVSFFSTSGNVDAITPTSTSILSRYPHEGSKPGLAATTDMIALYSRARNSHQWYTGNSTADQLADTMIRFTMYRIGGHDSWTRAYNNEDLWEWLFLQRKSGASVPAPAPSPSPKPSPIPGQRQIRVDFGGTARALPTGWNNGRALARSGSIALRTSAGELTPYDLTTIAPFNGVNGNGTSAPASALALPVAAAADSFFGNDRAFGGMTAPKAVLEIRDLDPSKLYRFEFFASRMGVSDRRDTLYRVIGSTTQSATLNASGNQSALAVIAGAKPNSAGTIRIEVQKASTNNNPYGFFYLGSLRISD